MKFTPLRSLLVATALVIAGTVIAVDLGSTPAPAPRTYVGQQTCMQSGCHEGPTGDGSIYAGAAAFRQTMHQKTHLRTSPETVVMEKYFDGDSVLSSIVSLSSAEDTLDVYLAKSTDRTTYYAQMKLRLSGDTTEKMKVAYTYGGNGWIERFLVEVNGQYHVLPFQYVLPAYRERTDTSNIFVWTDLARWMSGDPYTGKVTFFKWNTNRFRSQAWDVACASCHVNNGFTLAVTGTPDVVRIDTISIDPLKLDSVRLSRNDSMWTANWYGKSVDSALQDINISVGCESCHGPGSEHADHPTKDNIVSPARFGNTRAGTDLKLDLCNQCHNRNRSTENHFVFVYDESNRQPYTPGLPLQDFLYKGDYQYGATMWSDSTSRSHHQQGQDYARSTQYKSHLFKDGCWSCHTVHYNTQYPYQLDRNWYSLKDGEGCVSCHGSMGAILDTPQEDFTETEIKNGRQINSHTQHSPQVSQCVNCHFTKSATIAYAEGPRKPLNEFAAHTFKTIRPLATLGAPFPIGQINTCSESCHRNGRGSRNFEPSTPEAPAFGTYDNSVMIWNDKSDITLADSLWRYYRQMYASLLSGVQESDRAASRTALAAIAPNPFRTTTTIRYELARSGDVALNIYNIGGKLVRFLAGGPHEAGTFAKEWDGCDELGNPVPAGTYLVRLKTKQGVSTQRVVLVR